MIRAHVAVARSIKIVVDAINNIWDVRNSAGRFTRNNRGFKEKTG
jgi:hypothetical protein